MAAKSLYDFTIGLSLDQREIARSIQKQEGVLKKIYDSALSSSVEANFSRRKLRGLEDVMTAASSNMMKTQTAILKLKKGLNQEGLTEETKVRKEAALKLLKEERKSIKANAKEHAQVARDAASAYAGELRKHEIRTARRSASLKRGAEGLAGGKKIGGTIASGLGMLGSADVAGLAGMAGRGVGQMGKAGGALEKKLAARSAQGGKGSEAMLKMVGKVGGVLGKLAPILMAVGAVVGVFAALIKVMIDADALVKEFRTSLLKSNVSALDLGASMYGVRDAVDEVIQSFAGTTGKGFAFRRDWGVDEKEALKVVDAYAQAGVRITEFTDGLKTAAARQEALRKSTAVALTYANLLGMQGSEVAQKMGEMMGNLAQSLSGVQMQFSGLSKIASESAYSTKKFFSQVLQATSGMSMYNVRLEETGVLLKKLQGALGAKDGFEMLQKILTGVSGKSMQDRMKDTVASKGGFKARVADAKVAAADRGQDFMQTSGKEFTALLKDALGKTKLKLDTSSPEKLMQSMENLGEKDRQRLLGSLEDLASGNKGLTKQIVGFQKLWRVSRVFGGEKDDMLDQRARLAAAEGDLGGIYNMQKLFARLDLAEKLGEGKEAITKIIAANLGIDLKAAQQLLEFRQKLKGSLVILQEQAKTGKKFSDEDRKAQMKAHGASVKWSEKLGKNIVTGAGGKEIKTLADMLRASKSGVSKLVADGKETEDLKQAKLIAGSTTKATKILGQMMNGVLYDIFTTTRKIYEYLDSDSATDAAAARQKALQGRVQAERKNLASVKQEVERKAQVVESAKPANKEQRQAEYQAAQRKRARLEKVLEDAIKLRGEADRDAKNPGVTKKRRADHMKGVEKKRLAGVKEFQDGVWDVLVTTPLKIWGDLFGVKKITGSSKPHARVDTSSRAARQEQQARPAQTGGSLDKAGNGPRNITNNFWEGKGAFASIRAYQKARDGQASG